MDLSAQTLEELQARFVETGRQFAALGTERQEILEEIERRKVLGAARVRLGAMSTQDKDALRDLLQEEA